MSRFFSAKYAALEPYVPGEQPRGGGFLKLNTNESPFPPSPKAVAAAREAASGLNLYSDPDCRALREALARVYGLEPDELICANGSDEVLNFAFMAFCDATRPAAFADITYGFYKVFAAVNGVPYTEIPLRSGFALRVDDYFGRRGTIFVANPNAPTGLALPASEIERLVARCPDSVVVIDEAYIDYGGQTCLPLIRTYKNLLVTRTFSKSRSLAGARLGFGAACPELIADLNTVRFSTNPYNVNAMTMAAGIGSLSDEAYTRACLDKVCAAREWTTARLRELGFTLNDSMTNFVFAAHPRVGGAELCARLRGRGVIARRFSVPAIENYVRVSIGDMPRMERFIDAARAALEEA